MIKNKCLIAEVKTPTVIILLSGVNSCHGFFKIFIMGEQRVSLVKDKDQMRRFVKSLLKDVQAMEYMLHNQMFESGITRIGAEQEMVLVNNKTMKPAPIAMEILDKLHDKPWLETELAKFNLEITTDPKVFTTDCFSALEKEIEQKLSIISTELNKHDSSLLLTGILPTFRKNDLELHNLTPKERYKALMEAINSQLIGNNFELRIFGIDELQIRHSSPLLEACNTSFQVHLQTDANDFVKLYNLSQTLAAPVMAICANSPLVFGKRLWHESRIALFQQSIDVRTSHDHFRERSPRVSFGSDWLDESIIEIFKEDISRFRILISSDIEEDALALIQENKIPKLRALQVHNSTVYRWNRPCYGISDNGMPHLRIENRVLPAGPTIKDEVANACFWLGCMVGMAAEIDDIRKHIDFVDTRDNFGKAAKYGIDTNFTWFNDEKISACELVKTQLLGYARKGLKLKGVNQEDIDTYLGIIEARADAHTNGSRWLLRGFTKLRKEATPDEALSTITHAIINNQKNNDKPGHEWPMPENHDLSVYDTQELKVSELMMTDLITAQKDDVIELVSEMMNWKNIKYMPVEDMKGNLVGLVSSNELLAYFSDKQIQESSEEKSIGDIMIKDPITVTGETKVQDAIKIMQQHKIGCLPVVEGPELVGIITDWDFTTLSSRLMNRNK